MWVVLAFGAAVFAGLTSILAKIGIKNTDSNLATALRTIVVIIFAWLLVFLTGAHEGIWQISGKSLLFLVLSGFATGGSWLCYFRAIQIGDVNKVVPIDKSSTVLTMLLAFIFLGESVTWLRALAMAAIGIGTFLMIELKKTANEGETSEDGQNSAASDSPTTVTLTIRIRDNLWLVYAFGAAVFAALTGILGKVGITDVDSNLGTAIRTIVVLVMAWVVVFIQGTQKDVGKISRKDLAFIGLSGIATGLSWLCYYKALQTGPASIVVPIDKLSILITVAFAFLLFKEKLTRKSGFGLVLIVAGTLSLLI
ncbi:MAG: EamA family transporter [Propionibacteriaceae bacterium]|jgi:transporter family protein|nr:EamA family transporter [Propionibacteriaceae bacterium]